jgi:hypothetical protein
MMKRIGNGRDEKQHTAWMRSSCLSALSLVDARKFRYLLSTTFFGMLLTVPKLFEVIL